MKRLACIIAVTAAALASAGPAAARAAIDASPRPKPAWATVNVCDSVGHPDSIGIRGWMPGTGQRAVEMFMRLRVQYQPPTGGPWQDLGAPADSGFLDLGTARPSSRQRGQTFTITPPPAGQPAHELRGVVTFEWRRGSTVVRRETHRTVAGHPDTVGADPEDFSAATCAIS